MKNFDIILVVLFFLLFGFFFRKSRMEEIKNEALKTELNKTKDSLQRIRKDYKKHLSNCAFISTNSIQRISKDGRFITLYAPYNPTIIKLKIK